MSVGKCGRFSEEYPKCERFGGMRLINHECWQLTTNTGELEIMAWDAMLIFFTLIFHTTKKENIS